MSIRDLPVEISEEILRNVTERKNLKTLSLVSSQWCALARRTLFSKMLVLDDTHGRDFQALQGFLTAPSRPGAFIRQLTLRGSRAFIYKAQITVDYLHGILSLLPALERLTIQSTSFVASPFGNNAPHGAHRLAYLGLKHVGTSLDSAQDFFAALGIFSHIEHLSIHALAPFNDTAWIMQVDRNRLPALIEHLTISELQTYSEDTLPIFLDSSVPSRVKRLKFHSPQMQHLFGVATLPPSLPALLCAASTLEHISLTLYEVGHFDGEQYRRACEDFTRLLGPALAQLSTLRSVSLTSQMFGMPYEETTALCWAALLSAIAIFPQCIRQVELVVRFELRDVGAKASGVGGAWTTAGVDFRALHRELLRFEQLESVHFCGWDSLSNEEKEVVERGVPELARAGMMRYDSLS